MNRCRCNKDSLFFCHCSNVYLCHSHIGEHLAANHNYEQLVELNSYDLSDLHLNLEKRIKSLTSVKDSLLNQTKQMIKQIQEKLSLEMTKINSKLNFYSNLLNTKLFHKNLPNEIRDIFNTNIIINSIDSTNLENSISNFFNQELIKSEKDQVKDLIYKKNLILEQYAGSFKCIKISFNSSFIVTGSEDCSVRFWDLERRIQSACLIKHRSTVLCVDISKNSLLAASASFDKSVILWDAVKKECKNVCKGHLGAVYSVAFNFDSSLVVSGSYYREIIVWETRSGFCLKKILCDDIVRSCMVTLNDMILAGVGRRIYQWSLIDASFKFQINAHGSLIKSITTTKNEKYIISGSYDRTIKIWDTKTRYLQGTLEGHNNEICSVVLTSDDKNIISCSKDNLIIIWNIETFENIFQFKVNVELLNALDTIQDYIVFVSRDSKIGITTFEWESVSYFKNIKPFNIGTDTYKTNKLIFGSNNNIILTDINQPAIASKLDIHKGEVQFICLSKSESFMISCSSSVKSNLILWRLDNSIPPAQLEGHNCSVYCADISDDESKVASGDCKGKIFIWDLKNINMSIVLNGHSGPIHSIKFLHNNEFAASGGSDKKLFIWDIKNKCLRAELSGHVEGIWKVVVTNDDKYLVSADLFCGIFVWNFKECRLEHQFLGLEEAKGWVEGYREVELGLIRYLF